MLELRRYDPAGLEFGPNAYVFGNEVGERLNNYQKAWSTLRLGVSGADLHTVQQFLGGGKKGTNW
jgi:hypothetical protein